MEMRILEFSNGQKFVFANGPIMNGDAAKLQTFLMRADRDSNNTVTLALNSEGGVVSEALTMVKVMDRFGVSTVVPPGAQCASACAAILYISGIYRGVVEGGLLGFHSCSKAGEIRPECNDEIASNAIAHGTPYGSVRGFMDYASPNEMIWLGAKESRCWGLVFLPGDSKELVYFAPCVMKEIQP